MLHTFNNQKEKQQEKIQQSTHQNLTYQLNLLWFEISNANQYNASWQETIDGLFNAYWTTLFDKKKAIIKENPSSLNNSQNTIGHDLFLLYQLMFSKVFLHKYTDNTSDAHLRTYNYVRNIIKDSELGKGTRKTALELWENFYTKNQNAIKSQLESLASKLQDLTADFPVSKSAPEKRRFR